MTRSRYFIDHVVSFEETNLVGNVYYVNYLSWQGRCRELFLRDKAPGTLEQLQSGQLRMVTAHVSCDFSDEFVAFDEVRIELSLLKYIPFGVSLGFEYRKAPSGGTVHPVVARGRQDIKFLAARSGAWQLADIPEQLAAALKEYE